MMLQLLQMNFKRLGSLQNFKTDLGERNNNKIQLKKYLFQKHYIKNRGTTLQLLLVEIVHS